MLHILNDKTAVLVPFLCDFVIGVERELKIDEVESRNQVHCAANLYSLLNKLQIKLHVDNIAVFDQVGLALLAQLACRASRSHAAKRH